MRADLAATVLLAFAASNGRAYAHWSLPTGVRFECTGCSKCCRVRGDVWATRRETQRMARAVGVSADDFEKRYVSRRKVDVPPGWARLASQSDGGCVFLDKDGKCTVYDARPLQCRAYPFWPEVSGSRETWALEAVLPDDAPGPGRRWSPGSGGCEGISASARWIPGPVVALREAEYALYDARFKRARQAQRDSSRT